MPGPTTTATGRPFTRAGAPSAAPHKSTRRRAFSTRRGLVILAFMLPAFGVGCSGSGGNLVITTNGQTIVWPNVEMEAGTSITFNAGPGQTASKVMSSSSSLSSTSPVSRR